MALRLVEIILPADRAPDLREVLTEHAEAGPWRETLGDGQIVARLLVEADRTGPLVDGVDERFGADPGYQLLILPVLAALPRPDEPAEEEPEAAKPPLPGGPSREELYRDVRDMSELSGVFLATVVLSVVVAAVGMVRENVAAIIGAMVIAPFLGPNVALALGTTLGDVSLIRRAVVTNVVGASLSLALAVAVGIVLPFETVGVEILRRTEVGLSDVILAMAAGSMGALALTRGLPAALVGVMVAVALLPPVVALGITLGIGAWPLAERASLLLATNVICINLSGVLTFRLQGIRPRAWWEADRARRSARLAIILWVGLLAALVALIVVSSRG